MLHALLTRDSLRRLVAPLVVMVLAALLGVAARAPSPYALITPGEAIAVIPSITLPPESRHEAGDLYFTVVYVKPASWGEWVVARIDPQVEEVVPREEIEPPDIPIEQMNELNRRMMEESKAVASVVGLRASGFAVEIRGRGARVVAVMPNSPAVGVLQENDVILASDDTPMPTAIDLVTSVQRLRPGDAVRLTVRRGDQTLEIPPIVTIASPTEPERPMVGVMLLTELFDYDLPFAVQIESDAIGGPSAGLMFALGVYDLATPGVLGQGQKVAGTGTIALDGMVGPVGGAAQKLIAAEAQGAPIFIAPTENAADARAVATSARVVEVATFDDAVRALAPGSVAR